MSERLQELAGAGVSIWLDDLSRELIETEELAGLIAGSSVVGVTTNPAIFASALKDGARYAEQIREITAAGTSDLEQVAFELMVTDVARAGQVFADAGLGGAGADGRVSIEVSPTLAHDTEGTAAQAAQLWDAVQAPESTLIKIPATTEGAPAIARTIGAGISVNVTLIFDVERYRQVTDAYLTGLETAHAAGLDLSAIHSVASFFVSRVDTEIDARLEQIGTPEALALRGKAGLANARLAYEAFEQIFSGPRWEALAAAGANAQRPLWASTGVKNPEYPDTLYVSELVAAHTVNTMPRATLDAFADHGSTSGDTITGTYDASREVFEALRVVGVDFADVIAQLEREGVEKFVVAWGQLLDSVRSGVEAATA